MLPTATTSKFCEDHHVRIIDSNKRAYKARKMNVELFRFADDYNIFQNVQDSVETEPLLTVEISQSELDRIAEFESNVFNNMKQQGHYNMFETLMDQKQEEKILRDRYPAVKRLYEQYSMMLSLAKSGKM